MNFIIPLMTKYLLSNTWHLESFLWSALVLLSFWRALNKRMHTQVSLCVQSFQGSQGRAYLFNSVYACSPALHYPFAVPCLAVPRRSSLLWPPEVEVAVASLSRPVPHPECTR